MESHRWSLLGDQEVSLAETIVVGSAAVIVLLAVFPWLTIESGDLANVMAGNYSAAEITSRSQYLGYETTGGRVALVSSIALLAFTWVREWDGWTATGTALIGVVVALGPLREQYHLQDAHARALSTGTLGSTPVGLPDGTYAPLGAVGSGTGLVLALFLSIVIVVVPAFYLSVEALERL